MSGARRFKSLKRRIATKAPKPRIVIYSEGEKTERDYFEEMKRAFRSAVVNVEIIEGAGVPLTISTKVVEAAKAARHQSRRDSFSASDEFWAVFDRDDHHNVPDAIARCDAAKVGVAFSDPCFELWLILHFQDFDRPDHRHDVQRSLEKICPDYNRSKRKTTDCSRLMGMIEQAEQRAESQITRRREEGDPPLRPFTSVYKLTRRIRER